MAALVELGVALWHGGTLQEGALGVAAPWETFIGHGKAGETKTRGHFSLWMVFVAGLFLFLDHFHF